MYYMTLHITYSSRLAPTDALEKRARQGAARRSQALRDSRDPQGLGTPIIIAIMIIIVISIITCIIMIRIIMIGIISSIIIIMNHYASAERPEPRARCPGPRGWAGLLVPFLGPGSSNYCLGGIIMNIHVLFTIGFFEVY